jgi:hypothetical protein
VVATSHPVSCQVVTGTMTLGYRTSYRFCRGYRLVDCKRYAVRVIEPARSVKRTDENHKVDGNGHLLHTFWDVTWKSP